MNKIYFIRGQKLMLYKDLIDDQIILIFDYVRQLEKAKHEDLDFSYRNRIGIRS